MIGKFRSAFYSVLGSEEESASGSDPPPQKYPYSRPSFLSLNTPDELQVACDHSVRPILVPKGPLPLGAGYAETINAGKSPRNEDQASVLQNSFLGNPKEPLVYFGIFDGHAGPDAAIAASAELQGILLERLGDLKAHFSSPETLVGGPPLDSLIIGALESSFSDMDASIGADKQMYRLSGGCTALVALFLRGKLFVANAGDSRALLVRREGVYPMSFDFTPLSERQRLQRLGRLKPELLGTEYTRLDYHKNLTERDIGSKALFRDAHMTGWSYKTVNESDLKFPVVYGEGKCSRLLATIGVTRGFGDHELRAQIQKSGNPLFIKPFLSSEPEVRVFELSKALPGDVLVLGTDGLWDVVPNEVVGSVVRSGLALPSLEERYTFVSIAQELVMRARGKLLDSCWRQTASGGSNKEAPIINGPATIDDISVFVIPLHRGSNQEGKPL